MENQTTPSHLRPFDIEKAKKGAKVVTRNGLVAQILKYDFKIETGEEIMIVMISDYPNRYNKEGYPIDSAEIWNDDRDLFLLPNMREGWVNVYRTEGVTHVNSAELQDSFESAIELKGRDYIATARIEWEE